MAGIITKTWAGRLLEATAGRTAISAGTVYLGLAIAVPDDPSTATLSNITEVTTAGYARKAIPAFNAADITARPVITTPTLFSFNNLTADMTQGAPYAFLTDVASGTAGILRYIWLLPAPVLGVTGVPITVPASALTIE